MKKLLLSLLLMVFSAPAFAGPYHHRHHGHHHWNHHYHNPHPGRWIAPVIIGGVVGYALAQQPAPVIVQQQPIIIPESSNCTEWREVMQSDGTVVRERFCR